MKVKLTSIPEVILLYPKVHRDNRGYFFESFKSVDFKARSLPVNFVQDNQAKSPKGILRGLHYQLKYPQGKLVWVTLGKVLDVAVDIRQGSPTFGEVVSTILDDKSHARLYVPPGFAHGYYVLSDVAIFNYKCTNIYHPEDEYGINWNDPKIKISWGNSEKIVSEKDASLSNLDQIDKMHLPKYKNN